MTEPSFIILDVAHQRSPDMFYILRNSPVGIKKGRLDKWLIVLLDKLFLGAFFAAARAFECGFIAGWIFGFISPGDTWRPR